MFKCSIMIILSSLIVAHRGGAQIGNENTLSAFENAIAVGSDMVELDVHMTKDGHVVVCHDFSINRTTDSRGVIEELSLEEFKQAHALDRETGEATNEVLPTLEEALRLMKDRTKILIEIKRRYAEQYPGMEQKIVDEVNRLNMKDQVIVQSFDDQAIFTMNRIDPTIRLEKLLFCRLPFGRCFDGRITTFSFDKYRCCKSLNLMYQCAGKKFVSEAHAAGFEVKVWTVNSPKDVPENVDGIITNRPDLFRNL